MHDLNRVLQRCFSKQNGLQTRVIAVQDKLDLRVTHMCDCKAVDHSLRGVVATHSID
jgi:hypothetical protein